MPGAPVFAKMIDFYSTAWDAMQVPSQADAAVQAQAERLYGYKDRYTVSEANTGVPWWMLAAMHYRQLDCDFTRTILNGDRIDQATEHFPAGVGPWSDWESSANFALIFDGLDTIGEGAWTIERVLYQLEAYDEWGYWRRGFVSPFLFAFTDQYTRGRIVTSGEFFAATVDAQIGCAPLIARLAELDPSVVFVREEP